MKKMWAIGDIHGCARTLTELIEEKIQPNYEDEIYLLGDYIDRGPDAKGVIDYIVQLQDMGYQVKPIIGNHEDVLLRCYAHELENPKYFGMYELKDNWLYFGGSATLKSFGVKNISEIPSFYIDFLQSLPYYYQNEKYVLVHAGLNFTIDNPFSDELSMLWAKDYEIVPSKIQNRKIVHGHVPHTLQSIEQNIAYSYSVSLDNGCVYQKREGMGNLIALELNTGKLAVQANIDYENKPNYVLQVAA